MTSPPPQCKLERVPLREAWKHEASDFTPWLAEDDNLQALAEALGLSDLELVVRAPGGRLQARHPLHRRRPAGGDREATGAD